jgi:hypothetical protein
MRRASIFALVTLIACSDSLAPKDFHGVWVADGVRLTLSTIQSHFESSCWAGDLSLPVLVDGHEFTAVGTLYHQGGAGGSESRFVDVTGRLTGDVLHLTIEPVSVGLGPYTLERGTQVSIPGCP